MQSRWGIHPHSATQEGEVQLVFEGSESCCVFRTFPITTAS
jgi:hypothetical protein